ncbi:hypothetical protein KAS08_05600 [Candidatus Pacearchaeota archaeon]|nr:hypothetical protein [Candidatus Pacearchaeota archaeon]
MAGMMGKKKMKESEKLEFKKGGQIARGTLTDTINLVGVCQFWGLVGFETGDKRQFCSRINTDAFSIHGFKAVGLLEVERK